MAVKLFYTRIKFNFTSQVHNLLFFYLKLRYRVAVSLIKENFEDTSLLKTEFFLKTFDDHQLLSAWYNNLGNSRFKNTFIFLVISYHLFLLQMPVCAAKLKARRTFMENRIVQQFGANVTIPSTTVACHFGSNRTTAARFVSKNGRFNAWANRLSDMKSQIHHNRHTQRQYQ